MEFINIVSYLDRNSQLVKSVIFIFHGASGPQSPSSYFPLMIPSFLNTFSILNLQHIIELQLGSTTSSGSQSHLSRFPLLEIECFFSSSFILNCYLVFFGIP